jgi:2-polyprenyl-3-methyl-5-hydroxy-6-metoxy-1,4-benzoquinol methylase
MKPQQIENQRYKKEDHCKIMLEEEMMFKLLNDWSEQCQMPKSDIKILDLGCGSGLITKKIKNLGYQVNGLDFSEEAIKKAIANGIDAKICNLDEKIDALDQEYDVVWAGDIIEHVFDPIGLLKEINRVLKSRGILIICIPSDVGLVSRFKILLGYSYQESIYKKSGYYKHHTFFNLSLVSFMLNRNNFKIEKINKVLILNRKRFHIKFLPSPFYNELIIKAQKEQKNL